MLRCVTVSCALLASANGQCAGTPAGALEIRAGHGGQPCFTIPAAEELRNGTPDFQSITVREAGRPGKGGGTPLWTMAMTGQRTFAVTYTMCIPYAGRLPVLPQTPAAPLKTGQLYEVAITVRAPPANVPRSYRGWFCMEGLAGRAPGPRALRSPLEHARGNACPQGTNP
jgi:hypothetical protein